MYHLILLSLYIIYDNYIVYYISIMHGWCVLINMKPRSRIDYDDVAVEVLYSIDEMSHVNEVIKS